MSDNGVHASLVPLSDSKTIQYIETQNGSDFFNEVNKLKFGKSDMIDKALTVAYTGLIRPDHGERLGAPQVLVLLTDGVHKKDGSKAASIAHAIAPFHEAGIKVVVAGVATYSNRKKLEKLVDSANNLFIAQNLDSLSSNEFTNIVAAAACQPGKTFRQCHSLKLFGDQDLVGKTIVQVLLAE